MPDLSPSEALTTCERALRQLFASVYGAKHGAHWLEHIVNDEKLAQWRERHRVEDKRRRQRGVIQVPEDELAYAEFYDLCTIAKKHWEPLAPALGKRGETLPLLERFDRLRNTVAHSRPLLTFEADLLFGIAGEIRNRVTIYMTTQDSNGEHYPRIVSVTDSFGREVAGDQQNPLGAAPPGGPIRVEVGDTVTFACVGSDAQGRPLNWSLSLGQTGRTLQEAEGDRVTLSWTVMREHVQQSQWPYIVVRSSGEFHRYPTFDDAVAFGFTVPPPAR